MAVLLHLYSLAVIFFAGLAHSQVTVYDVSPLESPTTTQSANTPIVSGTTNFFTGGVNSEGATTIVGEVIYSLVVITNPTTTTTLISKPTTEYVTVVAGPSGISQVVSGNGAYEIEDCTFGSDGLGTCVDKLVHSTAPPLQTITNITTFSGTVVPVLTITSANPLPTTSGTSGAGVTTN